MSTKLSKNYGGKLLAAIWANSITGAGNIPKKRTVTETINKEIDNDLGETILPSDIGLDRNTFLTTLR